MKTAMELYQEALLRRRPAVRPAPKSRKVRPRPSLGDEGVELSAKDQAEVDGLFAAIFTSLPSAV